MAGQATMETREQVRACIKSVECNKGSDSSKAPKQSFKTTSKQ